MFYQRKREEETLRYHEGVAVLWNETAYANSDLLVNWSNNMLVPALPPGPRLLALDLAKFHSTKEVLTTLNSHNIIPSIIPCNLLLGIARFPEGDPAILRGQGGEASMEISTRDIVKMRG